MSGWNASSRPAWDPQGGAGENTQAFSAPEFPEGTDDWPEPGASLPGSGYGERRQPDDLQVGRRPPRHRSGGPAGLPQDARPVGPPPDIFQQNPGYPAAPGAPGAPAARAAAQQDQRGYDRSDRGQRDRAEYGYGREADDGEAYGREPYGREVYGQGGYGAAQQDYERQEDARRDSGRPDFAQRDYAGRDYVGRDDVDPDSAARMD